MNTPNYPVRHGKVRDIYDIGNNHLVMVATDRVSAFDQVLGTNLPGKGKILHAFDMFWADKLDVPYHCITDDVKQMPPEFQTPDFEDRTMLVEKFEVIPIECIVRAFLTGSAWKEYQKSGTVHGQKLPAGLQANMPLPEPIFTPSTKAPYGQHDENITIEQMTNQIGEELAERIISMTLDMFNDAYKIAFEKGVLIADTKFEWGKDESGSVTLIDEIMTPDSSRFWPVEKYVCPGVIESIDKQYIRDYLEIWWDRSRTPTLPDDVRDHALSRYNEALRRFTSE